MDFHSCDSSDELLLRLSLVEGVTLRDLRSLARPFPGDDGGESGGPRSAESRHRLARARESLTSAAAGAAARRIRDDCLRRDIRILVAGRPGYPPLLSRVPDAPLVLYVKGRLDGGRTVAVVGSRAPTNAGAQFARTLSRELAASGATVVSGMARGIDAAAHEGALDAGGTTVAVLGCGVDVVYPPEAGELLERVVGAGAAVSEYPPGALPLPRRFPARNRIISGLSEGVVVAEAPARSGALITARLALEQGREVLSVPGNPLFAHTAGSNRLIRDGATPVTGAEDVLAALGWEAPRPPSPLRKRILDCLATARHAEDLSALLGAPLSALLPELAEMEVAKMLERTPGDYYKRVSKKDRGN